MADQLPSPGLPRSPARGATSIIAAKSPSVLVYARNEDVGAARAALSGTGEALRFANPKFYGGEIERASRVYVYPGSPHQAEILAAYKAAGVDTELVGAPAPQPAAAPVAKPEPVPEVASRPKPEGLPPWSLKTTPQAYIERYGDAAPKSGLAQRYLDAGRPRG